MYRLDAATTGLILILVLPRALAAQSVALTGVVKDETGAAIPGASVSLARQDGSGMSRVSSKPDGTFSFDEVLAGSYNVKVELTGFEDYQRLVTVAAQAPPPLMITLRLRNVEQDITVEADVADAFSTATSSPTTTKLENDFLQQLPIESGDVMSLIGRFVSPGAEGAGGASVVVDGVQGDQLDLPSSAISKIRVDRSPYSALFQHPGKGRVELTTERGHRSRYDGSFTIAATSSRFNARNAFATSDPESGRLLTGGSVGGPLPGKRAAFYVSAERFLKDESTVVNAVTTDGPFVANVPASQHRKNIFTRVQWWPNDLHVIYATYSYTEHAFDNREAGGFNLPERRLAAERARHTATVSYGALLPPNWQNNLLITVTSEGEHNGERAVAPAIIVDHAFASGPAQTFTRDTRRILDVENTLRYFGRARHSIFLGGRLRADSNTTFDASNFGGTFEFGSLAQFAAGTPLFFRVAQGNPATAFSIFSASGFAQDEIRVKPQFTLTFGLRYDWQSIAHDSNNFAPRFGFVFAPEKAKTTVFRGGMGVFYDSLPRSVIERSRLDDGLRLSEVVISNPSFPIPFASGETMSRAPSVIRLATDTSSPYVTQVSMGVEQQLRRRNWITAEYSFLNGAHLLRSRNINAPLTATGVRPDPGFLNINQIESTASARSHIISFAWRGRVAKVLTPYAQYVLSSTTNDASGAFSLPANSYDLRHERGPADSDRRHRFNVMATLALPRGFQSGLVLSALSGSPFNMTTGFDDNGDTIANDRPAGVARNSGRGPKTVQVDIRLTKSVDIARFLGGDRGRSRNRLEFTADAFNAINATNMTSVVGVLSSPFFGRGNSAGPARTVQFLVRYSFRR